MANNTNKQKDEEVKKRVQELYESFYDELSRIETRLEKDIAKIMKIIDQDKISKISKSLKK